MAFTVTARHTGNSGTSSAQTHTSNSTTPTADSLFFAVWGSENDASATAPSFQTPTGGGLTYTQVAVAGVSPSYPWNGDDSFRLGLAAYRAAVGSSPSAFAITVDSSSTTATFFYGEIGFDVTGHDPVNPIVNSAIAGGTKATGNSETGTVAIGWTPAVGNLVIVCFTSGADGAGGFASPTAGAGKTFTTIANQNSASCQVGAFYRVWDGTESLTVTCSDLGDTVGNYGAIVFEVASGSGAPAAADAGLWVPASTGIIMPQSPLYFPFTTPWAGADITVQAATGAGDTGQRSSTQALGVKAGSGAGIAPVRAASATVGSKAASQPGVAVARAATSSTGVASQGATGAGVVAQRTVDRSTGVKAATGTATDSQRSTVALAGQRSATGAASLPQRDTTTSTGKKSPTASGVAVARASTASTGRKGAVSASSTQSRTATSDTGSKAVTGTAQIQARTASQETGNSSTGVTGSGSTQQRAATTSTGVKGGASSTTATCRSSAVSTGVHRGSGAATVMARPASAATGLRRTAGGASAATRPASASTAIRRATGTAVVQQHSLVVCTGAQVIPPTFGTAHGAVGPAPAANAAASSTASASAGSMTVPTATGG